MQKMLQLKKQIDQCTRDLELDYRYYDQNKQRVISNIGNFKRHLPALSTVAVIGAVILTFSTRARGIVGKINKNILLSFINVRLAINTITMLMNSFHHVKRLVNASHSEHRS